jgi:hypothetical protein
VFVRVCVYIGMSVCACNCDLRVWEKAIDSFAAF